MSRRPIEAKKRRRVARSFRTKLPTYFNLVQWLLDNKYAKTRREAKQLLMDHRLKYEGKTIGTTMIAYHTRDAQIKQEEVPELFLETFFRSGLSVEVAS